MDLGPLSPDDPRLKQRTYHGPDRRATSSIDILRIALGIATTLGLFSLIFMLVFHAVPKESEQLLTVLCGVLAAKWGDICAYCFNSTKAGEIKTQLLAAKSGPSGEATNGG